MRKRLLLMGAGVALALTFGACGGSDNNGPTPVPTPTPVTRADVHMIVDPNPIRPNYEGDGWYRFKVNLGFNESAGIGFTINTIRTTITSAATGNVLIDYTSVIPASLARVGAYGGTVLQFTSNQYHMAGGTSAGTIAFVVSITDDRQNAITITGQATMLVHGEPHQLP
jgi:hypothetical protein